MDRFFPSGNGPLTPSHHSDYQDAKPVGPDDEFIVMFRPSTKDAEGTLKEVFNAHTKPQDKVQPTLKPLAESKTTFIVKGINWPIINELREHPQMDAFAPNRKIKAL